MTVQGFLELRRRAARPDGREAQEGGGPRGRAVLPRLGAAPVDRHAVQGLQAPHLPRAGADPRSRSADHGRAHRRPRPEPEARGEEPDPRRSARTRRSCSRPTSSRKWTPPARARSSSTAAASSPTARPRSCATCPSSPARSRSRRTARAPRSLSELGQGRGPGRRVPHLSARQVEGRRELARRRWSRWSTREGWKVEGMFSERGELDEVFRRITLPDTVKR